MYLRLETISIVEYYNKMVTLADPITIISRKCWQEYYENVSISTINVVAVVVAMLIK